MFLTIADILSKDDLVRAYASLESLVWNDGKKTAGATAKAVKQNLQADFSTPHAQELHQFLIDEIQTHPVFKAAARPRRISRLIVSKTVEGGYYGPHIDNAIMRKSGTPFRTDLSFTLFLSPPESYEGGELTVHTNGGSQSLKPAAGDMVLYPSTTIHEVERVSAGERLVCVGWVESLVADQAQREILFDLENLRASLRRSMSPNSAERLTLDKSIANLMRLWAKP